MKMKEKKFEITGKFSEKGKEKKFSKKLTALNELRATDKALSLLGSSHKVKRRKIEINEVKEVK
jgi:large subunit ribosomal protein LX